MQFRIDSTQVLHIRVDTRNMETTVSYSDDFQGATLPKDPTENQGDNGVYLALDHNDRVSVKITGRALFELLTRAGFLTEDAPRETRYVITQDVVAKNQDAAKDFELMRSLAE